MKPRELEKLLLDAGWKIKPKHGKGSHRAYKHPERPGKVMIPWHQGKDISRPLAAKILKQAGIQ